MYSDDFQTLVADRARSLFERVRETKPSMFNLAWWSGKVMEWCMKNEEFKVEMFRFVDVLPYLNTSAAVARHLQEYFCRPDQCFPTALQWGINRLSPDSMAAKIAAKGVRSNIVQMAKQFITGSTAADALPNLKRIRRDGLAFTLDLLGEATLSWPEAREYQERYLELIKTLVNEQKRWRALGDGKPDLDWGHSPRVNISLKPSTFCPGMHPLNFEGVVERAKKEIMPIMLAAKEAEAFVNIDIEQYAFKDLTLEIFKRIMDEPEFADYPHCGIVIQAYLRESADDVEKLIRWARKRTSQFTIRLVKGAYWDYETVIAKREGWPVPVFEDKAETDANFEQVARQILENHKYVRLACASHNLRSIAFVLEYSRYLGLPKDEVEYQVLFGMAEPVRIALQEEKVPLRVYATVGELIPGMAYLVRRLLENTANESFLRQSYAEGVSIETLIEDPRRRIPAPAAEPPMEISRAPFFNEPHINWVDEDLRAEFSDAMKNVEARLGAEYPIYLNGEFVKTPKQSPSLNPATEDQVVGVVHQAGKRETREALEAAKKALPAWSALPAQNRAEILFRAADISRRMRAELSAMMVKEVGKTWKEADGDVTEGIDFLEYYGQEMIRLGETQSLMSPPGEMNASFYQPKGLAAVIAPWNFPFAISMGMVSAALVTGNCVLYKPASNSQVMGAMVTQVLHEAGIPAGTLAFLPGGGSNVGRMLVEHPDINLIAFTGSKDVGLDILQRAAVVQPEQHHIKKVITEMGGKNAVIVDYDADLDEAVSGILASAFGYSGQKCSACSRVIVLEENYDRFLSRLIPAADAMSIGDPSIPNVSMGPVIDQKAYGKVMRYIEKGKRTANPLLIKYGPGDGSFAPLAIFDRVKPDSPLAQDEIFGPVLSIIKVKDMDEALQVANMVPYALTGGFFSRSPMNIERARTEFKVGNLYINQGCTGAMVARQPFGGFKLSGIGSKAGGPDYLLHFMDPRCVTENTMRRGFAPNQEKNQG